MASVEQLLEFVKEVAALHYDGEEYVDRRGKERVADITNDAMYDSYIDFILSARDLLPDLYPKEEVTNASSWQRGFHPTLAHFR